MARQVWFGPALGLLLLAGACGEEPDEQEPGAVQTDIPDEVAQELGEKKPAAAAGPGEIAGATAMEDRVATLGLLNKRNNISRDIVLKPGETRRIDNVVVKLSACERTPGWERPEETGAFVQVLVEERKTVDDPLRWHKVFSGWLFLNSPSLNVVEHPIYDVWVKKCAMKYPGEAAAPASSGDSPASAPAPRPAADPSPTPSPPAAPAAPAEAPAAAASSDQ